MSDNIDTVVDNVINEQKKIIHKKVVIADLLKNKIIMRRMSKKMD
jgi:hypothetical protein